MYAGQKAAQNKEPGMLTKSKCVRKNREAKQKIAKFKQVC